MDKFGGMFRCDARGDARWEKISGMVLLSLSLLAWAFALSGCITIKTNKYTFNQGMAPEPAAAAATPRGLAQATPAVPSASGGTGGHTINVFEWSEQTSDAELAAGSGRAMSATGKIQDAASKLLTDMRQTNTDSNNPQTTNTNTTNTTSPEPIVEEELGVVNEVDSIDDIPEDNPIVEED